MENNAKLATNHGQQATPGESGIDDHPRGYPVGRTDLKGSLARATAGGKGERHEFGADALVCCTT